MLGRRLVAFRGASGKVSVLDGHCAHLGADLGEGCIVGEALRCPFHSWEYGADGRCTHIPGLADIPAFARQTAYPVQERHGYVFFFFGREPLFPLPFFFGAEPDAFSAGRLFSYVADCEWFMNSAHAFDTQHFASVHDRRLTAPPEIDEPAPFARRNHYRAEIIGKSIFDRLLHRFASPTVEITITTWGGTFVMVTGDFGKVRSRFAIVTRPLENGETLCEGIVFAERGHPTFACAAAVAAAAFHARLSGRRVAPAPGHALPASRHDFQRSRHDRLLPLARRPAPKLTLMKLPIFLLALCLSTTALCGQTPTPTAPVAPSATAAAEDPAHNELRALRDGLMEAMNKGDIDKLLTYLHPNVVVTYQDGEVARGREGVKAYQLKMTTGPHKIVESFHADVHVDELTILYGGTTGVSFGSADEAFNLVNGSKFSLKGRWSATLIKEDGHWLVASLHTSTNLFDNPLLDMAKRAAAIGIAVALAVGIGIGFLIGRWGRRR